MTVVRHLERGNSLRFTVVGKSNVLRLAQRLRSPLRERVIAAVESLNDEPLQMLDMGEHNGCFREDIITQLQGEFAFEIEYTPMVSYDHHYAAEKFQVRTIWLTTGVCGALQKLSDEEIDRKPADG